MLVGGKHPVFHPQGVIFYDTPNRSIHFAQPLGLSVENKHTDRLEFAGNSVDENRLRSLPHALFWINGLIAFL